MTRFPRIFVWQFSFLTGEISLKFVKMVQLVPALATSPEDSTTAVMSTFSYIKISIYLDPRTPEKIRTQRESGLGFLIFLKIIYIYIYMY